MFFSSCGIYCIKMMYTNTEIHVHKCMLVIHVYVLIEEMCVLMEQASHFIPCLYGYSSVNRSWDGIQHSTHPGMVFIIQQIMGWYSLFNTSWDGIQHSTHPGMIFISRSWDGIHSQHILVWYSSFNKFWDGIHSNKMVSC